MGDIGNAFSSIVGAATDVDINDANIRMQKETNRQNYQMFKEANQFTAEQADLSRSFNAAEAQKSRDFQSQQLEKTQSFNESMYQKYQSPMAQADMYRKAGINPVGAISGSTGGVQAGSSSAGAAASSSPVSSSGLASLVAPRVEVNPVKTFIDTFNQQQLVQSQARKSNAEANLSEIDSETRYMENFNRVRKINHEAAKALADASLSRAERDYYESVKKKTDRELQFFNDTYQYNVSSSRYSMEERLAGVRSALAQAVMTEQDAIFADQLTANKLQLGHANIKYLENMASSALIQAVTSQQTAHNSYLQTALDSTRFWKVEKPLKEQTMKYLESQGKLNDSNRKLVNKQVTNFVHGVIQGYVNSASNLLHSVGSLKGF